MILSIRLKNPPISGGWRSASQGAKLCYREQPSLELAFFKYPSLYAPVEYPRMQEWLILLLHMSNFYQFSPGWIRFLYIPSGLIFTLYLPVLMENQTARGL